jgi:hypothetical protein
MRGFNSPHEAIQGLNDGVSNGRFKNCANLGYGLTGTNFSAIRFYVPTCTKDCLVMPEFFDQFGQDDVRCPNNCNLFVDRRLQIATDKIMAETQAKVVARERFWSGSWRVVGKTLAAPFVFFRSLPALVQTLLIILLILWRLPSAKNTIIEILKAIGGK